MIVRKLSYKGEPPVSVYSHTLTLALISHPNHDANILLLNNGSIILIHSGITEVVYLCDKYRDTVSMRASRRMLEMAKVKLRQFVPHARAIAIDFSSINK